MIAHGNLTPQGMDTHNLTKAEIEEKRKAVYKGIAGLSEFREKQTTLLDAAVKELRFVQLDKRCMPPGQWQAFACS
jgi:hypothetical protein